MRQRGAYWYQIEGSQAEIGKRMKMKLYRVYETGTNEYCEGPFKSHQEARSTAETEGQEQGQFAVVPLSRLPRWYQRAVGIMG